MKLEYSEKDYWEGKVPDDLFEDYLKMYGYEYTPTNEQEYIVVDKTGTIMSEIKHDLSHEVYLDPKDNKEHINHGMLEYTVDELKNVHANYDDAHKNDVVDPNDGKINDWHTRHEDKHLEIYCDNHPDAFECRVYDD
tara:strand:- start:412 stop:822 length:411 start_codon:yes stop_codon:yes gene_type:complete